MISKVNIFCLPFAGGCESSYQGFVEKSPASLNIIPLELPGRGGRMKERPLTDIHAMAADVLGQVEGHLSQPYAIYGHSMGTLIGYILTRQLAERGSPLPLHLFLSGAHEPSRPRVLQPRHLLAREDFVRKLKELGGSPDEVLDDPEMLEFYEPLLRADFQATDTYDHRPGPPLMLPITIMIGTGDRISHDQALAWNRETTGQVQVIAFPGNHFFIFDHEEDILKIMEEKLTH